MPPSSFCSPPFPCPPRRRSRSSSPRRPLADPRNATITSHSTCSASRHSSRHGTPEQDLSATIGTSRGNSIYPQNRTRHFPAEHEGWPSNSSGRSKGVVRLATPTHALQSHSSEILTLQGLAAQHSTRLTYPSKGFSQLPPPSLPQDSSNSSQQYWNLEQPGQHSGNPGMFNQAHDFTVTGTFIENNVACSSATSNQFMKDLLKETIPGAAADSSARYPPPRCHPGTRLAILERCLDFIANCDGVKKVRWVVGAAGVGKSAIMQNVAESPNLPVTSHASVFFSAIGRSDGTKTIPTISYQLAARSEPYRQLIEYEIARDPSLLESSIPVQFNRLIVEPFVHHPQLNSAGRILIIIDGLDECNNPRTQQELLRLISDFCIQYSSSPIVWLIASRPEPHITSFFSRHNIMPVYEKEEVPIDSDEARADVERYLRDQLTEIREASDSLDPEWPEERDLWKLANAAGGLFAYGYTVIRYICDPTVGSPASQLSDVLNVIDSHPMADMTREEHPLALLDALYARILSKIPSKVMINARKLLLALASQWDQYLWFNVKVRNLVLLCNWLGITPDEAYAALNHLRSVLRVPKRDEACEKILNPFHKSFVDYISDYTRSGFSHDIEYEALQMKIKCAFRILNEAPDGVDFGETDYKVLHGILARGPGFGDKISLTWLVDDKCGWNDNRTRLNVYKLAIGEAMYGIQRGDPNFQSVFCIHLLTSQFQSCIHLLTARFKDYDSIFPHDELRDCVFGESRRDEFMMQGILKQIPLNVVDGRNVIYEVKLQFRRPATTVTYLSDPWGSSCAHRRTGKWEEGKDQNWVTTFGRIRCAFCSDRFELHLESLNVRSPDYIVPILFTSTGECCVEFRFVDPEDGMSEWTYWFWIFLRLEKRKEYGSTV